jgi:S-DNA-T family DNA segregation ATPase FtsK/SpoIIIE
MAKSIKKEKKSETKREKSKWHHELKQETKHSIFAVIFFTLSLVLILAGLGKAGLVGSSLFNLFDRMFGSGFFLIPIVFFLIGVSFLASFRPNLLFANFIGGTLFLIGSLGIAELIFGNKTGGYVGYLISYPLVRFFDTIVSFLFLAAFLFISLLIMFNASFQVSLKKKEKEEESYAAEQEKEEKGNILNSLKSKISFHSKKEEEKTEEKGAKEQQSIAKNAIVHESGNLEISDFKQKSSTKKDPVLPPLELLEGDRGKPTFGDIKANANIIKRTLHNFGIVVEMGEVSVGPSVTQFTLKPAEGIKLSRITALQNDLSLALASHPLRIEAPIPGQSLLGIEIPNRSVAIVGLKTLISSPEFQAGSHPLIMAVGRNVSGKAVFADLSKMPHLLIAGSTGSGKSICIHAILASFLYKNSADNLKFLMIDPKRVELTIYNGIPHLLTPVITEPKKAILALRWAAREMEKRYEIFSRKKVRDINSYKALISKSGDDAKMPYIVIIIDELADIMALYPRELESAIVRLAQMSRAVGIHLIVSTQRPSVEVITGLIKANITSRIAFQVASQIDSRTILDMAGAEKLLGNGDMLFLPGNTAKPFRIQGAFVSEKEIKRIVNYLENEYFALEEPDLSFEEKNLLEERSIFEGIQDDNDSDDELYEEAREIVVKAKKASSSYLQRRLRIGYARAARLLDMLEERGVVGPQEGSKPREVLLSSASVEDNGKA